MDTRQAIEMFGIDISLGQLRRCLHNCRKQGWAVAVELFQGMGEALPFADESFDTVLHVGGINFFSNKQKAIDEMIRVARPVAQIVVADESERCAGIRKILAWFSEDIQREEGAGLRPR